MAETLAAVLLKEPDLGGLPADNLPPAVRRLLKRCLEKDPRRRLQAIGEARVMLEDAGVVDEAPAARPTVVRRGLPVWALALPVVAAMGMGVGWWRAAQPVERPTWRFDADLGPEAQSGPSTTAILSPDGNRIAFLARTPTDVGLATQLLPESKPTILSGTDNAYSHFFSPDGQWIAFFGSGKLRKISVQGGAALTLCDAANGRGGWWGENDEIVASLDGLKLYTVPAAGGAPKVAANPMDHGMRSFRFPQVLPGGETVLANAMPDSRSTEEASVAAISLKTGAVKVILKGGYFGRYLPSGHLVYISQGTMFATPFDLSRLERHASSSARRGCRQSRSGRRTVRRFAKRNIRFSERQTRQLGPAGGMVGQRRENGSSRGRARQ